MAEGVPMQLAEASQEGRPIMLSTIPRFFPGNVLRLLHGISARCSQDPLRPLRGHLPDKGGFSRS